MEGYPKIMDKLVEFLQNNGHECMEIHGMENHQFKWCQKDICPETTKHADMKRRQSEVDNRIKLLVQKGHKCIRIYETYPSRFTWCEKDICDNKKKDW